MVYLGLRWGPLIYGHCHVLPEIQTGRLRSMGEGLGFRVQGLGYHFGGSYKDYNTLGSLHFEKIPMEAKMPDPRPDGVI